MTVAHVDDMESKITIVHVEKSISNKVSASVASIISPKVLKPYSKASARKNNVKSRQLKTRILTDTPVRNVIHFNQSEMKFVLKLNDKRKSPQKKRKRGKLRTTCLGIKNNVNQDVLHNLTLTNDESIKETL